MDITAFFLVFSVLELVTPLVTQGIKKILDEMKVKYVCNLLVLIVASVMSVIGMVFIYGYNGIAIGATEMFCVLFMCIANWLGSMFGYDKVMQILLQVSNHKSSDTDKEE